MLTVIIKVVRFLNGCEAVEYDWINTWMDECLHRRYNELHMLCIFSGFFCLMSGFEKIGLHNYDLTNSCIYGINYKSMHFRYI